MPYRMVVVMYTKNQWTLLSTRRVGMLPSIEMREEDKKKVELIHVALQQLLDERRMKGKEEVEEEEEQLLIRGLLSQLDSLEKDANMSHLSKDSSHKLEHPCSTSDLKDCSEAKEVGMDEVVKELRKIKRQNFITHCLLSVMIVAIGCWQFSEASFLFAVKDKLSRPFRSLSDFVKDALTAQQKLIEPPPELQLGGVLQIPHVDMPAITFNGHASSNNSDEQ